MKKITTLIFLSLFNFTIYYSQCNVIYVTPTGSGVGTKANPSSLLNAINSLASAGDHLKLDSGIYSISNPITSIPNDLIIEGGFLGANNWDKTSLAGATKIIRDNSNIQDAGLSSTRISAFELSGVTGFRFQDLTIQTDDAPIATTYGISTYGVYLDGCDNYNIVRCQIIVGDASDGINGNNGNVGVDGENGVNGTLGSDNTKTNKPGGKGGDAGSGTNGGAGGVCRGCAGVSSLQPAAFRDGSGGGGGGAGHDEGNGGNGAPSGGINGNVANCAGQVAITNSSYIIGPSGNNNCEARAGNHGTNGANGVNGCNGIDGVSSLGAFFSSGIGVSGVDGQGGSGGKGGSGGAGEDGGVFCDEGTASGGGGGGAGGQGGEGGAGGYGGGASFAVYLFNNGASGEITSCFLSEGAFGSGGIGGAGAAGGLGGSGGLGGLNPFNEPPPDIGPGGNGGDGGSGGSGGKGGNGNSGVSQNVFVNGTALANQSITVLSVLPEIIANETNCAGKDISFTTSAIGFWDFGPNSVAQTATGSSVVTKFAESGFHDITYNGNVYAGFSSISNLSPSLANAGVDSVTCVGLTLYAQTPINGTGTWTALTAGTVVTSINNPNSAVTLINGVNRLEWVVSYGACCLPTKDTVEITMNTSNTSPTSLTVSLDTICPGDSTTLTLQGGALGTGAQWVWYTGSCGGTFFTMGTGSTLKVSPANNTTYFVRGEGPCDTTACFSASIGVEIISTPADSIISTLDTVCRYDSITLSVVGGSLIPGDSWQWYESSCGGIPVGTGSSITIMPINNATYFVRGEGVGCKPSTCVSKIIYVEGAIVSLIPFDTICGVLQPIILNNAAPAGGYYSGTGIVNGNFDPVIADYGNHVITYHYSDPISGCNQTISDILVVSSSCAEIEKVLVVNTFSPNGDGRNDTWNLNLGNYTKSKLVIFNKWGLKVFESNERIIQWDGNHQGKQLPSGSYFYILEIDDTEPYKGSITIVR